jgi:histone acetyltransferase MYST1
MPPKKKQKSEVLDDVAMEVEEESDMVAADDVNSEQQQQEQGDDNNGGGGGGGAALSIDTSELASDTSNTNNNNNNNNKPTARTPTAMDNHPYARGAVIEVLHGVEEDVTAVVRDATGTLVGNHSPFKEDDDWWNQNSDDEVEDEKNEKEEPESGDKKKQENEHNDDDDNDDDDDNNDDDHDNAKDDGGTISSEGDQPRVTVRLCDIIDRVPVPNEPGRFRYYVHYRDFNRRMDEWVSMERIVSPPSVGNAKARAIKREEEKRKKQQQREEEKRRKAAKDKIVDVSAPRASRRRSTTGQSGGGSSTPVTGAGADDAADDDGIRRTRPRRRSVDPNDTTTTSGTTGGTDGDAAAAAPVMAAEKGIVALPTAADATVVGEHVVQTIAAQELDEHEGLDDAALREHEEVTKVKNVAFVELGPYQMETWYFSPLPKELLSEKGLIEVLYVCEFTFRMFARKTELRRFQSRLPTHRRHPPGNEIYRNGNLSMFEVDGFEERIYCQNLCYIAKLFLDHKTLYFDVDPFLFYVLCEVDERGFHPVGYYSKEKYSDVGYNLACILTFPCHQRKGYGRFLIAFSYELSKKEEKVGSPEKPMSDLGQQAYKPYWASTIVDYLLNQSRDSNSMSIMDISKKTSIMAEDIVFTLNQLSILKIINGVYFIAAEEGLLRTLAKKYPVKEPRVDPSKLHWTPFLTDVKRDKFSIHSKKPSVEGEETRGAGGF